MASADVVPVVISGPEGSEEAARAVVLFKALCRPYLHPQMQQRAATEAEACLLDRVVRLSAADGEVSVSIHGGPPRLLAELPQLRRDGLIDAELAAGSWEQESHEVIQGGAGALAALQLGAKSMAAISVEYGGGPAVQVHVLPSMTGLQLKSKVIAELGLPGGFQNYYLRLGGSPFGARTPVSVHPDFCDGCTMLLEDVGDRPKAVGHT